VRLSHGETDGIADALAEWASGDLDAGSVMGLGMAGSDAVNGLRARSVLPGSKDDGNGKTYPEGLQVVDRDGIAVEVEEGILKHATVPVAEGSTY
jgi:hypothetical protein